MLSQGIHQYSCSYLDRSKTVYSVVKVDPKKKWTDVRSLSFYSTPFRNRHDSTNGIENVLVSFEEQRYATEYCKTLKHIKNTQIVHMSIRDLNTIADVLRMDMVVIMSLQCDLDTKSESYILSYFSRTL